MQFVARITSVPVPKVYCAFRRKGVTYIVMERIDGTMANSGWGLRYLESKNRLLGDLKSMVDQLRNIPPPDNIGVANIDGGPIFDERLPNKSVWGPVETINDFHRELRDGIEADQLDDNALPHSATSTMSPGIMVQRLEEHLSLAVSLPVLIQMISSAHISSETNETV